jgi:ribonuclease P protein subunit POP4
MRKRDFMRLEFIGLEVEVIGSNHPGYLGVSGTVVDETKNTLTVRARGKEVVVPKQANAFQFIYGSERFEVQGTEIQHRPEDRIKKIR